LPAYGLPGRSKVQFGVTSVKLSHRSRHAWPTRFPSSTTCSTPSRRSSLLTDKPAEPAPTMTTVMIRQPPRSAELHPVPHQPGSIVSVSNWLGSVSREVCSGSLSSDRRAPDASRLVRFAPKADIRFTLRLVCLVPKADLGTATNSILSFHLVGDGAAGGVRILAAFLAG